MIGAGTSARKCEKRGFMPIAIFDSDTIPRDRRPEPEAAVVAAGRHLSKRFEGSDRRRPGPPEVRGADHVIPEVDISIPFDWDATAAKVTERVRAAMDDCFAG